MKKLTAKQKKLNDMGDMIVKKVKEMNEKYEYSDIQYTENLGQFKFFKNNKFKFCIF